MTDTEIKKWIEEKANMHVTNFDFLYQGHCYDSFTKGATALYSLLSEKIREKDGEIESVKDERDRYLKGLNDIPKEVAKRLATFHLDANELCDVMQNICQLLQGIKPDAVAENWWSEWDESVFQSAIEVLRKVQPYYVRNNNSKQLLTQPSDPDYSNSQGLKEAMQIIKDRDKEIAKLKDALEWYAEKSVAVNRYMTNKPTNTTALTAIMTELSIDAGMKAIKECPELINKLHPVKNNL